MPAALAEGELTMADGELTLEDLRHARLEAARLVFLSACESGLAGVRKLPEEFIGLPAGVVGRGSEMHDSINHVFIIMDGEAEFITGGKLVAPKATEPGQTRGTDSWAGRGEACCRRGQGARVSHYRGGCAKHRGIAGLLARSSRRNEEMLLAVDRAQRPDWPIEHQH
jgi:CHAT domain